MNKHLLHVLNSIWFILLFIAATLPDASGLNLFIEDQEPDCGSTVSVEIKVNNFDSLQGLQFSLHYDTADLEYLGGSHDFPGGTAVISENAPGVMTFLWYHSNTTNLSNGHAIYTLEFQHSGNCNISTEVVFSDHPTSILASSLLDEFEPEVQHGLLVFPQANCGMSVDAGSDQEICEPGGSVQLNGTVNSEVESFSWSPVGPLDNPDILDPTANVNATTTFTLEGTGSGPNLIQNWNFEQGNTGFTSEYTYSPNDLTPEGTYAVVPSPAAIHPSFSDCDDHTPGGQNLMAVNGAGVPNVEVWCQTVSINPNTEYEFSAWVGSVHPVAPAELQFSINGQLIGDVFEASGNTCQWEEFFATWNSGGASSATICIVNQNTALSGNDFALDDISFHEVCTLEDEVTVEVLENSEESIDTAICQGSAITINGQTIDAAGTYTYTLQAANGCDSNLTVNVSEVAPQAAVQPPEAITCDQSIVTLDGSPSDPDGGTITDYEWTTQNGQFVSSPSGPVVQVDEPGVYSLTIHTEQMGIQCSSDPFQVTVSMDTISPSISIGTPDSLECPPDVVTIIGSIDQSEGSTIVSWSTVDGNIVSGANSLTPEVSASGTYTMTVIQDDNGCSSTASISVYTDPTTADAIIASPDTLNCSVDKLTLDGSASSPANAAFNWSTNDGNILTDPQNPQIEIDAPGTYQLIVEAMNNCRDTSEVTVSMDTSAPTIRLIGEDTLTCINVADVIQIQNYQSLGPVIVNWYSPNGSIADGNDSLIVVDSSGLYIAEVTSGSTGCTARDTFSVTEDKTPPDVLFNPVDTLSCTADTVQINAVSQSGSSLRYQWYTSDGIIASSTDDTSIHVTASAWYTLELTDIANGCTYRDSIFVEEETGVTDFTLAASSDTINCFTPTIDLAIQGISDFNEISILGLGPNGDTIFSDTDTTATVSQAGLYQVEITNIQSGCRTTESITIEEDLVSPIATAGADDTLNCQMNSTILDGSASQGNDLQFQWYLTGDPNNPLGTTSTLQVSEGGVYILQTTNDVNGCTDRDTVEIFSSQDIPRVDVDGPNPLTCSDTIITIDGSNSEQSPDLSARWTTPDGHILGDNSGYMIDVNRAGSYIFHLENTMNGCLNTDTVFVEKDTVAPVAYVPEQDSLTCAKRELTLSIQPQTSGSYAYTWDSDPNGEILSDTNQQTVTVGHDAAYNVTITDTENGCHSMYSTEVVQDTSSPIADAGADKVLPCNPSEILLDGSASTDGNEIEYQWHHSGGGPITDSDSNQVLVSSEGTYSLQVTNNRNGCTDTDTTRVRPVSPHPVTFTTENARCERGGTLFLMEGMQHATSTAEIPSLGGIAFGDTVDNLSAGTYDLLITDEYGCMTDTSFTIQSGGGFDLSLPNTLTVSYGDSVQLVAGLPVADSAVNSVQWTPSDYLSCDQCLNPLVRPEDDITYTLTVSDADGCSDQATVQIRVDRNQSVYIPNAFSPNNDGINDVFTIYGMQHIRSIGSMEIFNRWGDRVFFAKQPAPDQSVAQWDGSFNGQRLEAGVFVYRIELTLNNGQKRVFTGDVTLIR